ncbi:MAG: FAD-binding oxidoreductase [Anaerolineae bacterium]|nr:FAD-binding oxidoreductase [Anaerolineae bacterium]MDW8173634.1 FAD-dependent oxidoreductase [Anaerolineae bacterium]
MTVSFWQAEGRQAHREADVVIVGAGLAGCSAAWFLRETGLRVVIVDKADVAQGASGRNAGFMISGLDTYYHRAIEKYGAEVTREVWKLSHETLAFWRQIATDSNGRVPIEQSGSFLLAESEQEMQELRLAHQAMSADGIHVIYHDQDPWKRGYYAALEQPTDGAVQPVALVEELLRQSGADFMGNSEVYQIDSRGSEVVVHTRLAIFHAQRALLCTNAYSLLLDPYFEGKVIPTRAQCLVTEPLPAPLFRGCGYSDYGYYYYRMTFDNRLLLGGARHLHRAEEHNTTEDRLNPNVQGKLDDYLRRHFADVAHVPIARRWSGIMGFSLDGLPLVGELPHKPNVYFAVGFTGHGLALAAGVSQRAVDLMLHNKPAGAVDVSRLKQLIL